MTNQSTLPVKDGENALRTTFHGRKNIEASSLICEAIVGTLSSPLLLCESYEQSQKL